MFAIGSGAFAWTKLARGTGNADPKKVAASAAVVGIIAFLFFFSLLNLVF